MKKLVYGLAVGWFLAANLVSAQDGITLANASKIALNPRPAK